MNNQDYTTAEYRLSRYLRLLALLFVLAVFGYLLPAFLPTSPSFRAMLPFVTNSAVKVSLMFLLAFIASGDVRRFRPLIRVIIAGHLTSIMVVLAVLIWTPTTNVVRVGLPLLGTLSFPVSLALWGSIGLDGIITGLLIWLYLAAEKARYGLSYLSPLEFRTLVALSEALIVGKKEIVNPRVMAQNVDRYLASFRARTKWIFRLVLNAMEIYPLLSLRVPLSVMNSAERRAFLENRFYKRTNVLPAFWRNLVRVMIRISKQLAYLGYYNNPKVFPSIGYQPFEQRPDFEQKLKTYPPPPRLPLHVLTESDVPVETLSADVVIIGSGAGASIMALGLLRHNPGLSIIMVERGDHTDRSQMSADELDMLSRLYADGALQLSRDFQFQILQGSCVGGSTVINNAVSFDLPADVLHRWNDPQLLNAGLDEKRLAASFRYVRELLDIRTQDEKTHAFPFLNQGAAPFAEGIHQLGLGNSPNEFEVVQGNIKECYGCGYCNIGCKYGKKLSMLDKVLPEIQSKYGKDALRIVAGCEAEKLHAKGRQITKVSCRFKSGRRIDIQGKKIVVAAGAISSSLLLLRSGVGGSQAGKHLSFNMGSPITAVFDRVINAYEGLQISHYLLQKPTQGFVMETWFNPPVSQALTMPGWFDDHFKNMLRYNRMSSVGILVPTESNGEVRVGGLFGRDIQYVPTQSDLKKLGEGLILAARIFLAGGAKTILPHTMDYLELTEKDLHLLRKKVMEPGGMTLGSGHPQGGNRLSKNERLGVVDPEFKVYGYDNLYVSDASVFPSSIGVNPQLTVMALADYASEFVANGGGKTPKPFSNPIQPTEKLWNQS